MAFQIMLNFFIAFIWMFLSSSFSSSSFVIGFMLGMLMIYIMRNFFPGRLYISRVWALVKLTMLFMKELMLANIQVFMVIIKPKLDMRPAIFAMQTELEHDWEITLLSSLITLTPGTIVVHVSDDSKTLYIHAIDIDDVESAVDSIKNSFEKAIMEVSRS
ncbi:Na+/H+ antiporter subunit E [Viridibacillus sp. YIM B01967]|uniref:Na+/H+ antiporter subunit E n=1 Tax=Viridibacillus soli TaxID=2798301 RepID=A0ABS1HA84_9BACL|nr:Na+/H+ antiporter subunit E [Viridibacillus soli]MBK3496184.1 Na+/H+ antiporter subunit E [Viridibacillus soli]